VHLQIDPSAAGNGRPDIAHSTNGANPPGVSAHIADLVEQQPARGSRETRTQMMDDGDNIGSLSPVARAVSLVIIAFQLGYTALDRVQYPLTFPRTGLLHAASISLGLIALVTALSPRPIRNWHAFALFICVATIASTTRIAVIDGDCRVLVGSIVLFLFAAGTLLPWGPRFQAALGASAAIAMLGYSIHAADPNSSLVIDWTRVVSAIALAQIAAVHSTRYRRKLAEQVAALAENQRLLMGEITLRAEIAAERERDLVRLQASESMLRKMFDASPDNIAINSLTDGRFIAANDSYSVAGYTRDDVIGSSVIELGMWPDADDLTRFIEALKTGRVKNMEIAQRRKDGSLETNLISASVVDVNGEACVISMTRDITEIKRVETSLRASYAAMRKIFDATLDIIVVTRVSDGAYIDFNQQFERTGYGQRDLDDSLQGKRQLWASPQRHQEFRDRMQAKGEVRNMEADFLMPDGSVIPAMLSAVQVELEGEACVVTMIRDLSAAKTASLKLEQSVKALSDSEETFRKLFDANLDSMTLTGQMASISTSTRSTSRRPGSHAKKPSGIISPSWSNGSIRTK
jgi:PAS domain S-box-containing protein